MTEQDKKMLQIGIFMGLAAVVGLGYWWFIWVRNEEDNQRNIQTAVTNDIKALDKELSEITLAEQQRTEIEQKAELVEQACSRLPSTPDAAGFLNNLVDILRQSGVVNRFVNKGEPVEYASYTEIPWHVRGVGQYFEFGSFINMVELNPNRFMRVKSLKVSNDPALPGYHPLEVEIGTFMFNE